MHQNSASPGDPKGVHVVLDAELVAGLEAWRRQQPEIPTRAAAIRRLLARAMANDAAAHAAP